MSDMKLELVVIPVSDVDRALAFYRRLGWRVDGDLRWGERRRIQVTPPGSSCSVMFGKGITPSEPGAAKFLHLAVSDIEATRRELVASGVDASEIFHDAAGGYDRFDPAARASGPDPEHRSYASFVIFSDPDGNTWLMQEITKRFPGRIDSKATTYASVADLEGAMRRAAVAHGEHEKRTGAADPNWPAWYAAFMASEQTGDKPPQ